MFLFKHRCPRCGQVYSSRERTSSCPICTPFSLPDPMPAHDGETYVEALDRQPLNRQAKKVFTLMADGVWRTLAEISWEIDAPEASVSARLRDFRKEKWGGFQVHRRLREGARRGLYEYRVVLGA